MMEFRGWQHVDVILAADLIYYAPNASEINALWGDVMSAGRAISAAVLALAMLAAGARAQQNSPPPVEIDNDDIGGVVTSRFGPEAGVWVIAQTTELGTRFAKIAVTDERGRYVVPDLPKAHYQIWVRGYGLVDSPKVAAEPGKILNLTAETAPSLAAAAHIIRRSTGPR
jgi:hypothetical protein